MSQCLVWASRGGGNEGGTRERAVSASTGARVPVCPCACLAAGFHCVAEHVSDFQLHYLS